MIAAHNAQSERQAQGPESESSAGHASPAPAHMSMFDADDSWAAHDTPEVSSASMRAHMPQHMP